jgi:hypothetical protein
MTDKKAQPRFGPKLSLRYVLSITALIVGVALIKYMWWLTTH